MKQTSRRSKTTTYKNSEVDKGQRVKPLVPLTENQRLYINAIEAGGQVIGLGPSGSGKSYIPATIAANKLLLREVDKVIITRPAVSVGKSLGSLPGSLEEKFEPWLGPILSTMEKVLTKNDLDTNLKNGNILYAPLEYMRGASYEDAMVIVDEAQNLTVDQAIMLVTRIGEDCTLVLNGDVRQSDLKETSGLTKLIHLCKKYNINATVVEFDLDDIVRSDVCKTWVTALYEEKLL